MIVAGCGIEPQYLRPTSLYIVASNHTRQLIAGYNKGYQAFLCNSRPVITPPKCRLRTCGRPLDCALRTLWVSPDNRKRFG